MLSRPEQTTLAASNRPDSWLCELTLQETTIAAESNRANPGTSPVQAAITSSTGPFDGAAPAANVRSTCSAKPAASAGVSARIEMHQQFRPRASDQGFLPMNSEHYIMLLDWTGRELRADKRGAIPEHLAPILERLGINRAT